eukprot:3379967-Pleurochrysis_carterae.AAC.1
MATAYNPVATFRRAGQATCIPQRAKYLDKARACQGQLRLHLRSSVPSGLHVKTAEFTMATDSCRIPPRKTTKFSTYSNWAENIKVLVGK